MVRTFLHVSDIHFHKGSRSVYCPDHDIRNEMKMDATEFMTNEQLELYGMIVCGDIAYSGKKEEYKIATDFIEELAENLKIEPGCIYCVPGNHDVDQSIIKKSVSLYAVQKLLENCDDNEMGNYLELLQSDSCTKSNDFLYEAIREYNKFAQRYGAQFSMKKPNWSQKIPLDEKYTLAVFGMNSTLISSHEDHKDKDKKRLMRLGRNQLPQREKNVIYMTVCHHPPSDWKDSELQRDIGKRAAIQLYGHKHVQSIQADENAVIIGTGALQPNRNEPGWEPRYNFLSIGVVENILTVRVYPRVWNKTKFEAAAKECDEGKVYKEITLPINQQADSVVKATIQSTNVHIMNADQRRFIHLFMRISKMDRKRLLLKYDSFGELLKNNKVLEDVLEQIVEIAVNENLLEKMIKELKTVS